MDEEYFHDTMDTLDILVDSLCHQSNQIFISSQVMSDSDSDYNVLFDEVDKDAIKNCQKI